MDLAELDESEVDGNVVGVRNYLEVQRRHLEEAV